MQVDLAEMERKARHEVERADRSDAVDEWVATPEEALALIARVRELEASLRRVLVSATAMSVGATWRSELDTERAILEKGVVLP